MSHLIDDVKYSISEICLKRQNEIVAEIEHLSKEKEELEILMGSMSVDVGDNYEGDCLPYPKVSEETLNKELDQYHSDHQEYYGYSFDGSV